jgi:hypothetical protein
MRNNDELYEFITELIQELRRIEDHSAATKLDIALSGATSTEIFMDLRYELENILATKSNLADEFRKKAIEALNDINTALSR